MEKLIEVTFYDNGIYRFTQICRTIESALEIGENYKKCRSDLQQNHTKL